MRAYAYLTGAILTEVLGTTALKSSNGFEHATLGGVAMALYLVSVYLVSLALVELPVGLVYATWSAVGIVGLAAIGAVYFGEPLDAEAVAGFVLIVAGVILLTVYSAAYSPV